MSSYQPGIPNPTDFLSVSQADIKNNFTTANNVMNVDHYPFDNATSNKGYHKVVHFGSFSTLASNPPNNQPVASPAAIGLIGQLFTAQVNDGIAADEGLYFLSGGGRLTQFTRNFPITAATKGATYIPGGIILNWNTITIGNSAATDFQRPFSTACWHVFTSFRGSTGSTNSTIAVSGFSTTGFNYSTNITSPITQFSYLAIGF